MGSLWPLFCSTVLLLVSLSSAFSDEQREVTFDLDMQDLEGPDPMDMLQRVVEPEFDLSKLLNGVFRPTALTPGEHKPHLNPRSNGGPPSLDYPVQFPLARPTLDNLDAICLHSDRRPRYPDSYFPASGFGQLKRKASAVNKAESWFGSCCERNQTRQRPREVTLCCVTKAWEMSVKSFCEEDSSVKNRVYHCCHIRGSNMLTCFNNNAQNPNYEATEEIPLPPLHSNARFNFNPNSCPRTVMTPRENRGEEKPPPASPKTNINFPPGQPTAETIESVCHNQKLRPLYSMCLSGSGNELLSRQAKTVNRIERGFKLCCKKKKKDVLNCAQHKWHDELNKFCSIKKGGKLDFQCCLNGDEYNQHTCFQNISPDPYYNKTIEDVTLDKICATHKIIKKKFPVGVPLKGFVDQCCPLSEEELGICTMQKLKEVSSSVCSSGRASSPAVRRCCRMPAQEIPQCISKLLLDAISKATKLSQKRRKKICLIS
ncbi:extracellular matrix protein 1-like [Solea solea]|uniref:extracellular matrix protein 1-like n=1 Tax=Solea solea TaxID=90069 RepID=UPI00272B11F4|nr:extracellular matrix protein 1-like [Solea solea]